MSRTLRDGILQPWWDVDDPPWWAPLRRAAQPTLDIEGGDSLRDDDECGRLLKELRERCPGAKIGYAAGELAPPIRLEEPEILRLMRSLLQRGYEQQGQFVWQDLDSELVVDPREMRLALLEGVVLVALPTHCEEMTSAEIVVPLATGTESEPAGLVMAAEMVARAPRLLVDVWGRTAVAEVWGAFIDLCRAVAATAGEDEACRPLLPGAVYSAPQILTIVPQARHAIDIELAE